MRDLNNTELNAILSLLSPLPLGLQARVVEAVTNSPSRRRKHRNDARDRALRSLAADYFADLPSAHAQSIAIHQALKLVAKPKELADGWAMPAPKSRAEALIQVARHGAKDLKQKSVYYILLDRRGEELAAQMRADHLAEVGRLGTLQMERDDPNRPAAERLLQQMRENVSNTRMNQAFGWYDEAGE